MDGDVPTGGDAAGCDGEALGEDTVGEAGGAGVLEDDGFGVRDAGDIGITGDRQGGAEPGEEGDAESGGTERHVCVKRCLFLGG